MSHLFMHPSRIAIDRMHSRIRSTMQGIMVKRSAGFGISLLFGLAIFSVCGTAWAAQVSSQENSSGISDFKQQPLPHDVKSVANWAVLSRDNGRNSRRLPFAIIDKVNAKVFVFDANGRLLGGAPALLGMGRGDRYDAETGNQRMGSIKPEDRNTPAGRFNVSLQRDLKGKEVLLIDYEAAIALHPVVKGTPAERRAERLNSATAEDNRISYGCINVPVQFYQEVVSPAFTKTNGVVYILPEKTSAPKFFGFPAEASTP